MKKSYIDKATYTEKIISHLLSCRSMSVRYAVLKELINEREKNEINKFKQSLYRLKTKGFIKISDDKIIFNNHKYMQENMTSLFFQKEERVEGVMVMFDIPEELEKAKKENKVQTLDIKQKKNNLKVILIESNNVGMPGFLRSSFGGKFDVVVQRGDSGHVNILTRPMKRPDIRLLAGVIRATESQITNNTAIRPESIEAQKSGRSDIAPNWYFDPATNSLQNGGVNPSSVVKTVIPWELFPQIIEMGLSF